MAQQQAVSFVSPVGRLVQGDVFKGQTTDNKGQPLTVKTGPNKGQPMTRYFISLAVEKNNPDLPAFWALLQQCARQGFPQLFNPQGQCTHPRFTYKMMDGDGIDNDGKSNADKPGFKGCFVFKFSSSFPPRVVHNGQYINAEDAIKRGYFIQVAGNAQPNIGSEVPGLYLNHEAVMLVGYGEEIKGGIDAIGAFAAAQTTAGYVPAGMTLAPPAPTNGGMLPAPGGMPALPAPGAMPGQAAAPMQMPGQQAAPMQMPAQAAAPMPQPMAMPGQAAAPMQMPGQQAMPQPNHAFVNNAIGQPAAAPQQPMQMPGQQAPAAQQQQLVPTAAAQGYTLDQWKAAGKTEQELITAGMFVWQ